MLNKLMLEKQLLNFFKDNNRSPSDAAKELASIIDTYIKSADVIVQGNGVIIPGSIVTVGSPTTQVNNLPVTSTVQGKGKIT